MSFLLGCLQAAGYTGKVKIGMDVAASEFYTEDKKYDLDFKNKDGDKSQIKTGQELLEMYSAFCKDYPIITIEDPFDQDDWDNYSKLTLEGVCQVLCPPWLPALLPSCTQPHAALLSAGSVRFTSSTQPERTSEGAQSLQVGPDCCLG